MAEFKCIWNFHGHFERNLKIWQLTFTDLRINIFLNELLVALAATTFWAIVGEK